MSETYEFSIEADGVARDADGNELDKDGKPIEVKEQQEPGEAPADAEAS
jgi:hypothetical protein